MIIYDNYFIMYPGLGRVLKTMPVPGPGHQGSCHHARTHTRSGTGTIFMPVPECPKCPKYPKIKKILKFQKNVTKLFLLHIYVQVLFHCD